VQKIQDFSEFMVCPDGQGGGSQFFAILCRRPLWTGRFFAS